jgi:hypothetical protein
MISGRFVALRKCRGGARIDRLLAQGLHDSGEIQVTDWDHRAAVRALTDRF